MSKKRKHPSESSLYTEVVKRTRKELRRVSTQHDHHYIEFGTTKQKDIDDEENIIVQSSRRSIMIVLQDMIHNRSPLIVITSAVAVAETDYESIYIPNTSVILPEPKKKLWPFQEIGVEFLRQREADTENVGCHGLMLCDSMALGKSLQSLTHIYRDIQRRQRETGRRFNGVSLIVLPSILVGTWIKEIENSFPPNSVHYIKMMGDRTPVPDRKHIETCVDIIFTTYTVVSLVYKALYCSNDEDDDDEDDDDEEKVNIGDPKELAHRYHVLYDITFDRVVLDEAHYVVNNKTTRFRALKKINAHSKHLVTGTPLQNSYANILACFDLIGLKHSIVMTETLSNSDELYIKELLDKVMIRRLKHEIKWDSDNVPFFLTEVDKQIVFIDFDTNQERILYLMYAEYTLSKMKHSIKARVATQGEKNLGIMPAIQLMRYCCIDYHIVNKHIIPNGMLLGTNLSTLHVKPTSFGEKLFYSDSCQYKHIDRDNSDLEYRAFQMNHKMTYHYQLTGENDSDDNDIETEKIYEWDPYRCDSPLIDLDNDDFSRQLYATVYSLIRDENLDKLGSITMRVLSILGIHEEDDDIEIIRQQINAVYTNLMGRVLPQYSTKQRKVLEYINNIEDPTDKISIFSDSVCFLRGMVNCLASHDYKTAIITGDNTKNNECEIQLERSRIDPSVRVLLVSLKKGNVGLNIPWINHVLFCSPWYNPQGELQAECRSQRIGQTKNVHIRYFILRDTIEERILILSKYKKNISCHLIDDDADADDNIDTATRTRLFDFNLICVRD